MHMYYASLIKIYIIYRVFQISTLIETLLTMRTKKWRALFLRAVTSSKKYEDMAKTIDSTKANPFCYFCVSAFTCKITENRLRPDYLISAEAKRYNHI